MLYVFEVKLVYIFVFLLHFVNNCYTKSSSIAASEPYIFNNTKP